MALSIYYSGVLKEMNRLPDLVAEVADICHDLHWDCDIIDEELPVPAHGLAFIIPGGEAVWLTFDTAGALVNPYVARHSSYSNFQLPKNAQLETVVQTAGADTHMRLINLLRYISGKYFASFELSDESEYWETGCADRCRDWFAMFACWHEVECVAPLSSEGFTPGQ